MMTSKSILLRDFFASIGKTQKDIAGDLGVTTQAVSALMTGKSSFGKKTAMKWAEKYGLSPTWLMAGKGSMFAHGHQSVSGDNNILVDGDMNRVNASYDALVRAIDGIRNDKETLSRALATIEEQQKTIKELLAILRGKTADKTAGNEPTMPF